MKKGDIVSHVKYNGSEGEVSVCDSVFAMVNWKDTLGGALSNTKKYLVKNLVLVSKNEKEKPNDVIMQQETIVKPITNNKKEEKFDFDLYNRKLPNGIILNG